MFGGAEVQVYEASFRRCRYGRILQSVARHAVSVPLVFFTLSSFLSPFLLHSICVFSVFVFPPFISSFFYSFYSLFLFYFLLVATRLRDGRCGVRIAVWARDFPLLQKSRPVLGPTQPQWILGFFVGVNRPGREANNSLSFSAEVKYKWSHSSTPSICLHVFRLLLF